MADDADMAQSQNELADEIAVKTYRKPGGPSATGYCLFCFEELELPQRWCGAECRDGWAALCRTG